MLNHKHVPASAIHQANTRNEGLTNGNGGRSFSSDIYTKNKGALAPEEMLPSPSSPFPKKLFTASHLTNSRNEGLTNSNGDRSFSSDIYSSENGALAPEEMLSSSFLKHLSLLALIFIFTSSTLAAPAHKRPAAGKYQPTIESLNTHPLPAWYADAKLGIFIHWGLYSVPGWAVLTPPGEKLPPEEYLKRNPYAEWYLNTLRLDGSPTQAYHKEHYGADYDYYNFAGTFDKEIQKWNPQQWAQVFKMAGARYVVLTSKHHEGFTLWPSETPNPTLPKDRQHASRDLVGELTKAVRAEGLRMGLYYSGGYDWTFIPGPIRNWTQAKSVQPQTEAYGKYADAQMCELIAKYQPAVLWNDINYPKSGHPLEIMAEYYNAIPDGVIDDRFGVPHSDFVSPEYETLNKISAKKWEECRGLGRSFGYNRAEGEAETIKKDELIYLLVDIVSKNGNLLLDVGPEADGTIPAVQMDRLKALGAWLDQNGEGIYATHPWKRAEGETADGLRVRFTQKSDALYAFILGEPKSTSITIRDLTLNSGSTVTLLGAPGQIKWTQSASDLQLTLPSSLPGHYAYTLKLTGAPQ